MLIPATLNSCAEGRVTSVTSPSLLKFLDAVSAVATLPIALSSIPSTWFKGRLAPAIAAFPAALSLRACISLSISA